MSGLIHSKTALNGDFVVQDMVADIVADNEIKTIIETGTHTGLSTIFFSKNVQNVITTEINSNWMVQAQKNLKDCNNIKFFQGDSAEILKQELPKLKGQKILFFLDAHFNNDMALDRELSAIADSEVIPYIMIHDFQVPSRPDLDYDGWDGKIYNLENLEHFIKKIYPNGYKYYYNQKSPQRQRGCIFIEPKKDKLKKVVYTAMFGGFDDPHDPNIDLPDWDMFFFTDATNLRTNQWKIINVPRKEGMDDIQMSRVYKMFPHLYLVDYDVSLWIDASILIQKPIDGFLNYITNDVKMAMYPHTNSWDREFGFMDYWCNDKELLSSMKEYFIKDGFDPKSTIINGNVIFREHASKDVIETMNLWWEIFNKFYIKRDQVGLAYSIWKTKLKVNFFDGLYPRGERNPYFLNIGHKKNHRIK